MKKLTAAVLLLLVAAAAFLFWSPLSGTLAQYASTFSEREPDIPEMLANAKASISKEEFLQNRFEGSAMRRGMNNSLGEVDRMARPAAVAELDRQALDVGRRPDSPERDALLAAWSPIGPAPIISGSFRYSGRTTAIAIHPANPDIVYVGTAQGGLYRTTNGGGSWVPLMDGALSVAIGAVAISPSNPEIVYVGTGEANFSLDSFFGVGVYRIDNASTTANLTGPLNKDGSNNDIFTGRAIAEILVHPSDAATIFVATGSGTGGISGVQNNTLPTRGVYRSSNATGVTPTFAKLTGLAGSINASVRDIAIDPSNPNILVAALVASAPTGGLYRSTDALAAAPAFTQTFQYTTGTATSELTAELAVAHPVADPNATFYAGTGNLGGRVLISTDGGGTWTQQVDNNFCSPQCFYDIAIAVDPNTPSRVYLGGAPAVVAAFSTTSGTSFTEGGSGVHVDTHAIEVSKSNPTIVYLGTDGGIYKSTNSGASYTHLNTSQFYATQYMGLSIHPFDANFTLGGTQDNGTLFYDAAGTNWTRVDGGDGGYSVIDQNAADLTNVRMYHTYFSQTNNIVGYVTRGTTSAGWTFRGCNGGTPNNGITCTDPVLFYAPLEGGPGSPNTIYYGTDRLYRSDNLGLNHTVVSQAPIQSNVPISAIGISPESDAVRAVGLTNGVLMGTGSGSSTLVDLDPLGAVPNGFIARATFAPNDVSTLYVTLANFGVPTVWKGFNVFAANPTWTNISTGIPQVPTNAFVVDPTNPTTMYVGTDIGVYISTNGGANWTPFGTGLPRVAVFDMAITNANPRKLRIATHGKGMYEIALDTTNERGFIDFDGDRKTDLSVFRPSPGQWWYNRSTDGGTVAFTFGTSSDVPAPADYTGDGKTDIAFFRPSNGNWFILRSEDFSFFSFPFGTSGDVPAPSDFDGDGRSDATVYRPANNTWYINRSSGGTAIIGFGAAGDVPVPGEYDGDGLADIAVYRPSSGQWWILKSGSGIVVYSFGNAADRTVQGDYTGDTKTDVAIYRPSTGEWFILRSEDASFYSYPFGAAGDIPTPGDYDGDGRHDAAIFRPSTSVWFAQRSTAGTLIQPFGVTGDVPLPNVYVR